MSDSFSIPVHHFRLRQKEEWEIQGQSQSLPTEMGLWTTIAHVGSTLSIHLLQYDESMGESLPGLT